MSNTLVIHPSDPSTDFLCRIYEGYGFDVLRGGEISRKELVDSIKSHDRIIMMGHGTPGGLINPRSFRFISDTEENNPLWFGGYVIGKTLMHLLAEKETISIWCNSDRYFESLKRYYPNTKVSLHTGMIISECAEQQYVLGKVYLNQDEQLQNMNRFADVIHDCINESPEAMREYILEHYTGDDEVTKFNRKNIILV